MRYFLNTRDQTAGYLSTRPANERGETVEFRIFTLKTGDWVRTGFGTDEDEVAEQVVRDLGFQETDRNPRVFRSGVYLHYSER